MSSLTACILHKLIAQSSLSGDPPESMGTMVISTEIRYSSLPESYVRPESDRPKLSEVEDCQNVPIIDLGCEDRSLIVHQTGQVINHGVSMEAVEKMQQVANEFFNLSVEKKMKLYSDDPSKTMRLSTSFNLKKEMVHNWRDYLRLHCNPLDQYVPEWPSNPPSFNVLENGEALFRKKLSPSDVRTCLEIPRRIALDLPMYEVEGSNGKAEMVMRVRDQTGRNWGFRRGSRRDGRGFLVKNWKKFITQHCLKVGDSVEFYLSANPLEYECFVEFQTYERHTQNFFR
ncbi:unnamed protein product [Camellia sinensis]